MKLIAMFGAAALAAGTLVAAASADAQRHGWDRGGDRGWDQGGGRGRDRDGRDWDRGGDRGGWDRGRGWDHGRHLGWDRGRGNGYGYGYGNGRGYGRSRVVCRIERGYYGPERRCFRVYR